MTGIAVDLAKHPKLRLATSTGSTRSPVRSGLEGCARDRLLAQDSGPGSALPDQERRRPATPLTAHSSPKPKLQEPS